MTEKEKESPSFFSCHESHGNGTIIKGDKMKKNLIWFVALLLLMTGCQKTAAAQKDDSIAHKVEFYDTFDTVIDIVVYAKDDKKAEENLSYAKTRFEELHKLFDRYHSYEQDGKVLNNIKVINDNAGIKPVKVSPELYGLLSSTKDRYETLSHKTNILMGPVIDLWAKYRDLYTAGASKEEVTRQLGTPLPTQKELDQFRPYLNMDDLVLNETDHTVFLKKKGMEIDTGAVAKGYATEIVAKELEARNVKSALISAGGNVRVIGAPADGREYFRIGIQNPDLHDQEHKTISILKGREISVVTSGDYQRYFDLDKKRYCHIIDPDTLMPCFTMKSATVVTQDSGLCDFLSTAFFLSSDEEIGSLAEKAKVEALWLRSDGKLMDTVGMKKYVEEAK